MGRRKQQTKRKRSAIRRALDYRSRKQAAATMKERHGDDIYSRMAIQRQVLLRGEERLGTVGTSGINVWIPGYLKQELIDWLDALKEGGYDFPEASQALLKRLTR